MGFGHYLGDHGFEFEGLRVYYGCVAFVDGFEGFAVVPAAIVDAPVFLSGYDNHVFAGLSEGKDSCSEAFAAVYAVVDANADVHLFTVDLVFLLDCVHGVYAGAVWSIGSGIGFVSHFGDPGARKFVKGDESGFGCYLVRLLDCLFVGEEHVLVSEDSD